MEAIMSERTFAVLGLFDTPDALMHAIPRVRKAGLGRIEAYTPYPLHGMDEALELRRSPLAGMVVLMAFVGAIVALAMQGWMSAVDYPVITGGKAPFSWQAFVPIMFELMVLFATFTAGLGMLFLLNRLPFFGHPVLSSKAIQAITRDRFALAIEAEGRVLDREAAAELLRQAGAMEIEILPEPAPREILDSAFILRALGGIVVACGVAGVLMFGAIKVFPMLPPMSHMHEQAKLNPYKPSSFFKDGHGMQSPVRGTVARGHLPMGPRTPEEANALVNPLPRTQENLEKGRMAYTNRCAVCHGPLGDGVPTLTAAYGAKPANLISEEFRKAPDGRYYWAIVKGKNAMPSHEGDMPEEDRWAAIHYVRGLQRAQNAKDSDLEEARP